MFGCYGEGMEIRDLINSDQKLEDLSNKDLYHLCQEYGRGIKALRRIFSVLLVEVFRRNLHRKYGFESIHEFGSKVGGMNRYLVDQLLWLAESLKDKPFLWRSFRREGWSKVRVVASVATKETDESWAEKVSILSKLALEELVKHWKNRSELTEKLTSPQTSVFDNFPKSEGKNKDFALPEPKTLLVQNPGEVSKSENIDIGIWKNKLVKIRFNISEESEFRFRVFKQKLSKKRKMAVTSGETFQEMLEIVEREWWRF